MGTTVRQLTRTQARRLTDEVKRDAASLWRKLLRLHEGGAHTALGYASWHAYCDAEFGIGRSHAYRLLDAGRVGDLIPQLGNEAQGRALAPLLRDQGAEAVLDVYRSLYEEFGDAVTAERIRSIVDARLRGERQTGFLLSSASQEWYTPAEYIGAARDVLGTIDLDPASSDLANQTVRARRFYTAQQDGLRKRWRGRVWLNPPYGVVDGQPMAGKFAHKLLEEYKSGRVTAAIMMLNGMRVEARWFEPLWDYPLCFAGGGRLPFFNPHREDQGQFRPSMMPVFVYLGVRDATGLPGADDYDAFVRVFSRFGYIARADPTGTWHRAVRWYIDPDRPKLDWE